LSGSEKLYHVEVPEHENVISVKTSSGAYKNIEREIERIVDDLEILDSFSDDENDEEADGFFDVSQIKQLIEKSEKILSMERISSLDSVDGRHGGYDKFDAIKDEIDNDSGSYESAAEKKELTNEDKEEILLYDIRMEVVDNLATDHPEMLFQTVTNKSTQTPIPKSKAKEMVASNLIEKIPASNATSAAKELAVKFDLNGKLNSVFSGLKDKLFAFAEKIGVDKLIASEELNALLVERQDFTSSYQLNPDISIQTCEQIDLDWTLFREFGTQVVDDLKLHTVL